MLTPEEDLASWRPLPPPDENWMTTEQIGVSGRFTAWASLAFALLLTAVVVLALVLP